MALVLPIPLIWEDFTTVAPLKVVETAVVLPHQVAAKLGYRLTGKTRAEYQSPQVGCGKRAASVFLSLLTRLVVNVKLLDGLRADIGLRLIYPHLHILFIQQTETTGNYFPRRISRS